MYANYNDVTIEDVENVDKQVYEYYKKISEADGRETEDKNELC